MDKVRQVIVVSALVCVIGVVVFKVYPNYPTGRTGVVFYYCTKSHEDRRELNASVEGVNVLPLTPDTLVNIIIHGYTESSYRPWVTNLTDALLTSNTGGDGGGGDVLVILVDYWDLITISRPYMMENVRKIASDTASLIDLIVNHRRVRLSGVHLIGFSLGGRISGMVGSRITSGTIGRITGLDASYPWLMPTDAGDRDEWLDSGDAGVVVTLRTSTIGSFSPPGHIDFIANGGHNQPGCAKWYLPHTAEQICSHYRSVLILLESVRTGEEGLFPACKISTVAATPHSCNVINHFSSHLNTSIHGTFHLSTNSVPPYSKPLKL